MPRNKDGLTPKQERFVAEYLVDLNATQAAIRAGYSPRNADVDGPRLLGNAGVAAAVERGKAKAIAKTGITAERVLAELEAMAFSSIDHYVVNAAGDLELAAGAPALAKKAIASIERKEWSDGSGEGHNVEVKYKFWDKPSMLKVAGKYADVKGFADKVEVTGKDGKDLLPTLADAMAALMNAAPKKA